MGNALLASANCHSCIVPNKAAKVVKVIETNTNPDKTIGKKSNVDPPITLEPTEPLPISIINEIIDDARSYHFRPPIKHKKQFQSFVRNMRAQLYSQSHSQSHNQYQHHHYIENKEQQEYKEPDWQQDEDGTCISIDYDSSEYEADPELSDIGRSNSESPTDNYYFTMFDGSIDPYVIMKRQRQDIIERQMMQLAIQDAISAIEDDMQYICKK